jgi:hypothetical protein
MIAFSATVRVWVLVLNPLSTIFQLLKVALNTKTQILTVSEEANISRYFYGVLRSHL